MLAQPTSAQSSTKRGVAAMVVGALALLLGVAAILLIALGAVGLARTATPNMQGFNAGATVTVPDRGISVYARSDADRGSTLCTLQGGSEVVMSRPVSEFSVAVAGSDFYEVARAPESLDSGEYVTTCAGTNQALYVGPAAPSTTASGLFGPASIIGGIMLGFLALILAIIAWGMRRSRAKSTTTSQQAYPSGAPSAYSSPYADSPGPAHQQDTPLPQGQPHMYGQPSATDTQAFAPPPPGGYGPPPVGEPTQTIAYGQGYFDQSPQETESADADAPQQTAPEDHDRPGQDGTEQGSSEKGHSQQIPPPPPSGHDWDRPYPPPPPPA